MVTTADVVVIGGGIAGTSAAAHLAADASVLLLEQEPLLGHHTTGRSAALYTENYGNHVIRTLAKLSHPTLVEPSDDMADHTLVSRRGLLLAALADAPASLGPAFDQARRYVPTAELLSAAEVVERHPHIRSDKVAGAVWDPEAADIDVGGLQNGWIRLAGRRGASIEPSRPVTSIVRDRDSWTITTPSHTVSCGLVVNAAGAWGDVVAAMAGIEPVGLSPLRRTAFTFPAPESARDLPFFVHLEEQFYFKPEGPDFLGSLAEEVPSEPCDARHREEDVALAIDRINEVSTLAVRHVRRAWTGLRTFTADRTPLIGPDDADPTFVWCVGQGGYGIKTSPALGEATAALALHGGLPDRFGELGLDADALTVGRLRAS